MGEGRSPYGVVVGKPEGKRQLGRFRPRWEDNIKMDLQEVGLVNGLNLSGSGQGSMVGFFERGDETSWSIK
jgi:hypothetical protein